jgi:putative flippase GtrA
MLYYILVKYIHITAIGIITNILTIIFSFVTYKMLVFKTKGNWLIEYLRCYVVYGLAAVIGILAIGFLVDGLHIPFWLAQAFILIIIIVLSYFGYSRFSFTWV